MTISRVFAWTTAVSWIFAISGVAAALAIDAPALPGWVQVLIALTPLPAIIAIWSPIGLLCARGLTSDRFRALALAGVVLTPIAIILGLFSLMLTGSALPTWIRPVVSHPWLPPTGPVSVAALVCAHAALMSRVRADVPHRLVTMSVATMVGFGVLILAMMAVDTGDARLFAVAAAILATSVVLTIVTGIAHWRRRRVA
jgi:hypothetical protein